jgi:hypothetical protein
MEKNKKLLIIGNKYHGKTTFANFIVKHTQKTEAFSTSSYLVYRLSLINNISEEQILKEKEKYRPDLIELGNAMCNADAGCLVSICLWSSSADTVIIDGVRRISEFSRVSTWFDKVVWIYRESEPIGKDNLELTEKDATDVILNNGSLEDLEEKAKKFISDNAL